MVSSFTLGYHSGKFGSIAVPYITDQLLVAEWVSFLLSFRPRGYERLKISHPQDF